MWCACLRVGAMVAISWCMSKGVRGLAEVEKLVIAAVFLNFQDKNILLTPSAMNTTYLRRQVLHLGGFNISPTAARRSSYG